jgi:DNA-directed RNA polymerase subunit RPC12/RpoP
MGFTVEQECPQCGAPVELDETDRLLRCPYCRVKNFLFARDYFRFLLPAKNAKGEIFHVPYLRFKGNVYFCGGQKVGHRVVDITRVGVPFRGLPESLGLRPQAMKLKFVTPKTGGVFLRFSSKASDILTEAGDLSSASSSFKILHRAFIGETLSLIYLPVFVEGNRVVDGILERPLMTLPQREDFDGLVINNNPQWRIRLLATLCPRCGWNLEGDRDSVVLVCSNCETHWEASTGQFARVSHQVVPGQGKNTVYLPFWKTAARTTGLEINSFADFLRLTRQPRVVLAEQENQEMNFWSPAFKIRPKVFLQLARQLTISQKVFRTTSRIPKQRLYPVTLPHTEAFQAMKVTLASSALDKKRVFPRLPQVRFHETGTTLVYLPFEDMGHEMVQQGMPISIQEKTLEFGRQL